MQKTSFAEYRPGERGFQAPAVFKIGVATYEYIDSGSCTAKRFVSQATAAALRRCVIRHYNQKVIIAVLIGVSASYRPKEIDFLRPIGLHQTAHGFSQD
jgi:hypothetical protein